MTDLHDAAGVSQLEGSIDPWESCGPACCVSVLRDAGQPATVTGAEQWWQATYGSTALDQGTTEDRLVAYLAACGVPAHVVSGPTRATIDAALDRRHRVIWAIFSDRDGNPGTRWTGHFVEVTGRDPVRYRAMNPLASPPGQTHDYPLDLIEQNSQNSGVEIDVVLPADTEDAMTPDERRDLATVICRQALYELELGRVPSVDELEGAVDAMVQSGFAAGLWSLTGSPEAQQHRGVLDRLAALEARPATAPVDETALTAAVERAVAEALGKVAAAITPPAPG